VCSTTKNGWRENKCTLSLSDQAVLSLEPVPGARAAVPGLDPFVVPLAPQGDVSDDPLVAHAANCASKSRFAESDCGPNIFESGPRHALRRFSG
jgi:hypothetical protein